MRCPRRPLGMRIFARLLGAIVLAVAASAAPTGTAVACSCGFSGYADAIAAADVAFIGTVVAEHEPNGFDELMPEAIYAFEVARAKAPMESPYELSVVFGDGANCGFDMSIGEEYVVIASAWEGHLTTNLCNGTALTEHLDPGELGRIEHALAINDPDDVAVESSRLDVPGPVLAGGGGLVLVGLISLLAFRRAGR